MSVSITDEVLMKKIFKEAVAEFFQEHREWFSERIQEEEIHSCKGKKYEKFQYTICRESGSNNC